MKQNQQPHTKNGMTGIVKESQQLSLIDSWDVLNHPKSLHEGLKGGVLCRVRAMLAMRACRSSIMIGKHLDRQTMRQIVGNLAQLDSPWNCPHGRPTMRHLALLPPPL